MLPCVTISAIDGSAVAAGFIISLATDFRIVKREGMEDITYKEGDSFIVGPKTPKHTMGNAKDENAIVWFAAIGAKDVPILIPSEG